MNRKQLTWESVANALVDKSIWNYSLEDLKEAVRICVSAVGSGATERSKQGAAALDLVRDIVSVKLREQELAAAKEANELSRKEADEKAARAEKRSWIALWVSWGIGIVTAIFSGAAVAVSVIALLQENPVAQEVKYLTDQVAGLKEELVELRKAEERADHVIVVPGEARE